MNLETQDIQGVIVSGYGHLPFSSYLFLHIDNCAQAQEWLRQILPVTNSDWHLGKPKAALNIAFTYEGLKKLGLPEKSLDTFPAEFIEGMTEPNRSRRLGDVGANAPEYWEEPWKTGPTAGEREVHILLILQAPNREGLHRLYQEQRHLFESNGGARQVAVESGYLPDDNKEHFGFQDSISQPEIEGSPKQQGQACIKAGEFILGYLNEDGNFPPTSTVPASPPSTDIQNHKAYELYGNLKLIEDTSGKATDTNKSQLKDLGRNGSYLVFRKLHQDVAGFRQYFRDTFSDPQERELMAAKIVGRWPNGAPLTLAPSQDQADNPNLTNLNDFSYMDDPHGYRCPIGAHIRRTNPRDSLEQDPQQSLKNVNRRRILRRGALYGEPLPKGTFEDDEKPRGVLFFCINASIRRQFEFIQQAWIDNPKFNGLYNEKDPLIGCSENSSKGKDAPELTQQMTIQQESVRQKLTDLPNFVSIKGGAYFFLPSISALYFLANKQGPASRQL